MLRNCLKNRADVVTSPFGHRGWKSWKLRSALSDVCRTREREDTGDVGVCPQGTEWKPRSSGSFLMVPGYSGKVIPLGSSGTVFFSCKRRLSDEGYLRFPGPRTSSEGVLNSENVWAGLDVVVMGSTYVSPYLDSLGHLSTRGN